ncbi:hypothetical protein At12D13_49180 (plasmid) [Agrobacterium fabrum]|nr:hypothetical protein At12D13_49180 [Agrobacterium fabrum]
MIGRSSRSSGQMRLEQHPVAIIDETISIFAYSTHGQAMDPTRA